MTKQEEAAAALKNLKEKFAEPGGPEEWLAMAREEFMAKLVEAMGSGDTKQEELYRGMVDLFDTTVVASRLCLVYELTKDLGEKMVGSGVQPGAAEWLSMFLRNNRPKPTQSLLDQMAKNRREKTSTV